MHCPVFPTAMPGGLLNNNLAVVRRGGPRTLALDVLDVRLGSFAISWDPVTGAE